MPAKPQQAEDAARLLAVQALYQIDLAGTSPAKAGAEFTEHWAKTELAEYRLPAEDAALMLRIIAGAPREKATLDARLGALLKADWTLERLDSTLRALLRAASWELLYDAPARPKYIVRIYTDMAHAFCEEASAGMANAILDRLASSLVSDERTGKKKAREQREQTT